tara:strand:- start:104 stop:535 length:432 start_codon:yes stop_codon:yes gene_type:complete
MFNLFKKRENNNNNNNNIFVKTAALLIHAAKIDQNYNDKEKKIIKKTLVDLGIEKNATENIFGQAEKFESNSNQILEFTKEIKKTDHKFKVKIIEVLWRIIYSDGNADNYETNLMRRLTGLLYIDDKTVGEIKKKIHSELNNL